jgi:TatD DNase family protein
MSARLDNDLLVDTHCHVDLYENPSEIVEEADSRGVYTVAVTNAPFVYQHTANLVAGRRYVRPALGLHPELVHSHGHQTEQFKALLGETRYVGEVGLDYTTTDASVRQKQRDVLDQILAWCAEYGNKIITLHSRRASRDTIAAIGKNYPGRAILHWFSGSAKEVDEASENGLYFSVNAAMVRSKKGQDLISRMPVDRLLTESDGPFVRVGTRAATPCDVDQALDGLATIWGVSRREAGARVLTTFRTMLG